MSSPLDWARDGGDWPHREASRFVSAAGTRWHVQVLGDGPPLLLLHGTGAASHSWRGLAPLLAVRHTVIAPDLPGHGFTGDLHGAHSLPAMAQAVASLLATMGVQPACVVGHSAGAAIGIRMVLDEGINPRSLVSLGGALLPWRGVPALLFAPLARLLASTAVVPRFFAGRATDPSVMARLVDSTGSRLDEQGVSLYRRLASNPQHVAGALAMMADWDLAPLQRDLPGLQLPLLLVHGERDRMVSDAEVRRIASLVPRVEPVTLPGLGHLAHEEDAPGCARLILPFAFRHR